ncbi:hypothetical protein CYY_007291 [Polysphondylium violaceum]|uniref:Sec1-like family protein n=1 Tax=Polysphondylium violaceum TaxID=133409 RepID=A0A8J4PNW7_9MYCE|nr:hypothetical protein CYY_007291 [Polysphondylium violaceum]
MNMNSNTNNPNQGGFDQFGNNSFSIKEKQIESINRMLSLKASDSISSSKPGWQDVWKILIFDTYCSSIISPILTKGALRNQGITLYLPLHSDRQPIQDAPAIYFVLPTLDNIKRIAEDCKNKLYDNIYLNFASKLPNNLMEELATLTIQSDSVSMISKLYEQFLNFVTLEKDLFTLNFPKESYLQFNDPTIKDSQAQENIDSVVDSLFSVLVTMSVIPIIRCPKNGAAEMIATQLEKKISQHLLQSGVGNLFSNEMGSQLSSFYRPVLIILDRNIDLSVMLHHPWTYQALAHDILNMSNNRVKVDVTNDNVTKKVTYDLDSTSDYFWSANTGAPFFNVAGEVKNLIKDYTDSMEKLKQLTDVNVDLDSDDLSKVNENKSIGLGDLVSSTKEKKRLMDLHTNLATDLMKNIRDRQIDCFFTMEEAIITRTMFDKKELNSLITSPVVGEAGGKGTLEDKLRLLLIYYLSTKNIPTNEMETYEDALTKMGLDLTCLQYFKKTKAFNESLLAIVNQPSTSTKGASSTTTSTSTTASGFMSMLTGYQPNIETFASFFSQGVRSLLPKSKDLFVTRVVESIMDLKNTLDADYLYMDPKIQNKSNVPRRTTPFKEAIVFTVGGGNYVEYQNLQDYSKKSNKKIIYGTTELLTSKDFLAQIKTLKDHTN